MAQATVLIIEDNVLNARLAETVLADAGYRVFVATTGEQALPMFHAHRPDVVLMDIQLPRMDGLTALRYFRTDPLSRATKIIAVTAMAMKRDRERMLAGGFDGYVAKPYLQQELLDAVRAALGPAAGGDPAADARAPSRSQAMPATRPTIGDKRRTFHQLHAQGCFIIPNPWDVGSARYLEGIGFKALATTSAGFAWSAARPDGAITRDMALDHLRAIVAATDAPVNADFENGFAPDAAGVAESVRLAVETGVAGLSIEDSTGNTASPLFDIDTAVARIRAARGAIDKAGGDTLLVGRAECFLVGRQDLDETIARLKAYAQAGADCLYAPALRKRDDIVKVVNAVAPKPFNLLVGWPSEMTLKDIAEMGVRRVSVGGALARTAWGGFVRTAKLLAEQGKFDGFAEGAPGNELNAFFRDDMKRRG